MGDDNQQQSREERDDIHWFMISTITGREWLVRDTLVSRFEQGGFSGVIPEIRLYELSCSESIRRDRLPAGIRKSSRLENMYPGYVFIRAQMTDELWSIVRNTKYVTGLLGSSGKGARPTKISDWKMNQYEILFQERLANYCQEVRKRHELNAGMLVRVTDGPYKGHLGKVYSYNFEDGISFITLDYFGKKITREIENKHLEVLVV